MSNIHNKQKGPHRLIRLDEVLELLPISKSTWWDGVRTGKYPTPVKLGDRITCWRLDDVLKLVDKALSKLKSLDSVARHPPPSNITYKAPQRITKIRP